MENILKKDTLISIISSLIFLLVGLILVLNPNTVVTIVTYTLGTIFILIGLIKIILYFIHRKEIEMYSYEMIFGICMVAIGIFTITCSNTIETLFRIIVGIWIIYSGLMRLILSIRLKNVGLKIWPMLLIIAIIMIIGGIYVLITTGSLIISIGMIMIIYAVMDLIEGLVFYFNIKKLV